MYLLLLVLIVSQAAAHEIFFEENSEYPVKIGVEITKRIESVQSPFMKIDVYETARCGNMLVLDGAIQLTHWDNNAYHEMIAHVPLMTHHNPKKVLIIGGGDGGTLSEVVKYHTLNDITLCDIDGAVIEISKKHFPEFAAGFTDPRVTVVIQDAAQYIKNFQNTFDIIIVDASDPDGPASVLYSHAFYQDLYNALTDDGIIVAQAESPFFHTDLIAQWHARNKQLFTYADYYYTLVPTYPSGVIGFTYCAKRYHYTNALRLNRAPLPNLRYYTPALHQASFILPAFFAERLR